jgi:hypothetical protein
LFFLILLTKASLGISRLEGILSQKLFWLAGATLPLSVPAPARTLYCITAVATAGTASQFPGTRNQYDTVSKRHWQDSANAVTPRWMIGTIVFKQLNSG